MANKDKENKIKKFTKEAIGKTLNQFNKEIGMADLVEVNKNQDRILNGILSQVNDENTEKTEKSNIITLDNSTDGIVELKEIQGDTNVNVSKIEEMPITHDIGDKEGNVFTLNEIPKGAISIGEIQGNTMVNCNKEADKELILMEDLSTEGYSNITLNKGVDGGKVDIALEGNTMVNVCDQKDPVAITKSYTVETGNHVALQGEYDGKCRPVVNGNTLVNLCTNSPNDFNLQNDDGTDQRRYIIGTSYNLIVGKTYTLILTFKNVVNDNNYDYYFRCNDNSNGTAYKLSNGVHKIIFTMGDGSTTDAFDIRIPLVSITAGARGSVSNPIILEGDYTNKPTPEYFEGLQSSFEDKVVPENLATKIKSGNVPKYNVLCEHRGIKQNTTYTLFIKNNSTTTLGFYLNENVFKYKEYNVDPNRYRTTLITPTKTLNDTILIKALYTMENVNFECYLVEGDYTNYDFTDYDPTKAGKYKVDYVVTGKNKLCIKPINNGSVTYNGITWSNNSNDNNIITINGTTTEQFTSFGGNFFKSINFIEGKSYYTSTSNSKISCYIAYIDEEGKTQYCNNSIPYVHKNTNTIINCYIQINGKNIILNNEVAKVQVEEGNEITSYEPYKEYTKTFYLNSPLLEGDTIEQSGNNIYHVHRYKKVVLDGSADEGWAVWEYEGFPNGRLFATNVIPNLTRISTGYYMYSDKYKTPYNHVSNNDLTDKMILSGKSSSSDVNYFICIADSSYSTANELKSELQQNPVTVVYKLATPEYELISENNTILCDSYTNGHLAVDSVIPIEKVTFLNVGMGLKYLYPDTKYIIQFNSDNVGKIEVVWLSGGIIENVSVLKGLNKIEINTPNTVQGAWISFYGIGFNASNIVVTEATDKDFGYFEGMKSVGECEDLEVVSCNKNLFDINIFNDRNNFKPCRGSMSWGYYPIFIGIGNKAYLKRKYKDNITNYSMCLLCNDKHEGMNKTWIPISHPSYIDTNYSGNISADSDGYVYILITLSNLSTYKNILDEVIISITDSDYIPHAHNTQTLTHEPLRAVGNIKDRYVLIDGKWYIERNCAELVLDGSEHWKAYEDTQVNNIGFYIINTLSKKDNKGICNKFCVYSDFMQGSLSIDKEGLVVRYNYFKVSISKAKLQTQDIAGFKQWLQQNPTTVVYQLQTPQYEPIDYNPFEVYSDTTHISNNSTIPCNMTIKNTGYNCLLKPSTTYTVSSNLGLNTVTTPSVLSEDCLRFYDTDTSTVTKMKNVTILEGDYTTGKPIPSHFSGIESAFEQEYDEEKGKYKVKVRVQNEDASKENYIEFYINEPLRGIGDVKDKVYVKDDKVVVERNCGSVTFDGSDDEDWIFRSMVSTIHTIGFGMYNIYNTTRGRNSYCNNFVYDYPDAIWNIDKEGHVLNDFIHFRIHRCKLQTQDVAGFKQWLRQNPTTVVYQLEEPVYEEVEYSSNRLILNTFNNESFNNSTLFLDTNISPKLSFKPLYEELVYVKNSTKYYIQFNAVGSGEVVINLGGTELTTEIVEGYNCIPITTPSESTNLMTIIGQGITISEVVVSEVVCGGYYKGLQSCFEEHMENGKYRILLRGIALDGSKVNGIKLYINEPLRGIGEVKDRLCIKDGKLMAERKCGEIVFDGSDDEIWDILLFNFVNHTKATTKNIPNLKGTDNYRLANSYCDKFIQLEESPNFGNDTQEYYAIGTSVIEISINNSKLSSPNVNGIKKWLQQNPTKITYELKNPVYEEVTNEYGLPIVFEGYENGIVYIDSAITPTTHIKYTSNNVLATTLSEAEEQNNSTQDDINVNVVTYMMDIDMLLTEMEMSNDISVMAVRRDSSNENMLDRMSDEDKKVYQDNTVVMLEKMITANVLDKEDIEGRIDMYYNKNRISKEQYKYLKSLL